MDMQAQYEILPLTETFSESLRRYFPDQTTQDKIIKKIKDMLAIRPKHYKLLAGTTTIGGVSLVGLRRMKVGAKGNRGGAVVFYRICEECKNNGHDQLSDILCQFCDDNKGKHIVIFSVRPRGSDICYRK